MEAFVPVSSHVLQDMKGDLIFGWKSLMQFVLGLILENINIKVYKFLLLHPLGPGKLCFINRSFTMSSATSIKCRLQYLLLHQLDIQDTLELTCGRPILQTKATSAPNT
jgi:hypothetical protein